MFDYQLLDALSAVVRQGTFQKAAKSLHITQSAVSQRIRNLEEQFGRPLLRRSTPPALTPFGETLVRHARQVEMMEAEIGDSPEDASGEPMRVVIGVNADSLATWFLDALVPALRSENLLVELLVENEDHAKELLRKGEVIGCVSAQGSPLPGCGVERLGVHPYLNVAAPAFRKNWFPSGFTLEAARFAPAVLFDRRDHTHEKFLRQCFGKAFPMFPHHIVPSSQGVVEMIVRGEGYGMLPKLQAHPLLRTRKLLDLSPGTFFECKLYWHHPRRETPLQGRVRKRVVEAGKKILGP